MPLSCSNVQGSVDLCVGLDLGQVGIGGLGKLAESGKSFGEQGAFLFELVLAPFVEQGAVFGPVGEGMENVGRCLGGGWIGVVVVVVVGGVVVGVVVGEEGGVVAAVAVVGAGEVEWVVDEVELLAVGVFVQLYFVQELESLRHKNRCWVILVFEKVRGF